MTGDKGLAGDFNNGIIRAADDHLKKNGAKITALVSIGRKAVEHYRHAKVPLKIDHAQFFNRFDFGIADTIGQEAMELFLSEKLDELTIVHSRFKSMMKQEVALETLLPITPEATKDALCRSTVLEPADEREVLQIMIPMYLKARFYAILRDSYAAELAARMSAMDNATRNADTLIYTVTLEMNKGRQALITREIAEIIATNEVVK